MKKKLDIKKLVLLNLPYVFAFYFVDKLAAVFRLAPGTEFIDKLTGGFANFGAAFANPLPSFHPVDLLIGVAGGALLKLAVYIKGKNRKKFRQGEEYGSARWGRPEDIRPYMDDDFSNNVILTQTEGLTMNSRPKQPKYARNKNILVIGGSGSGKTRFFVKPNLMQMHSSYVVTDPKGTVLVECGKMLEKNGYIIKSLNTINFRKSMHYNPFAYIRSEKDILKLVNTIIVNTKGDGDKSGEDFWVKAEKLYYTALIGYIWYEAPEHEKNFTTLLELINASEAREDDETFKNPVDLMFDELEERDPDHFAVKQYRKYKLAAGKTAKSILISCGARLAPFDIAELRELMGYDEMELDCIGDRKTALFVIISDTDDTYSTHYRDTECPVGERYSEAWIEDTAYKAIGQMLTLVEKKAVMVSYLQKNEEEFAELLARKTLRDYEREKRFRQQKLVELNARYGEVDMLFERTYEDNVSGKLSDERFMKLSQKYDEEQHSLKKEIAELESICDKEDSRVYSKNQFLKAVRKFMQMKTLTPTMLHELVERIDVYHIQGDRQKQDAAPCDPLQVCRRIGFAAKPCFAGECRSQQQTGRRNRISGWKSRINEKRSSPFGLLLYIGMFSCVMNTRTGLSDRT